MSKEDLKWFSISEIDGITLVCANCNNEINLGIKFYDHDPCTCPICKIECAYLDWRNRKIQVVPKNASPEFQLFLEWLQRDFDELEYVELMVCFEEITNKFDELSKSKVNTTNDNSERIEAES